ncbi:MAG: OmpA family protein [Flavobacteriales bacterium]|nr:OmpA family protein [Flavobacteriales bacterium]
MKGTRLVLIPITVAWFTGGAWYMARQTSLGHFYDRAAPSPPKVGGYPSRSYQRSHRPGGARSRSLPASSASAMGEAKRIVVPELTVRFGKNTQELALAEEELVWCAAAREHLAAHPQATITVTGYTDGDGDAVVNERLSLVRAELVRARLIDLGAPADRITAVGMGAKEHISDNLTSKGKALNRRVVIHVMQRP